MKILVLNAVESNIHGYKSIFEFHQICMSFEIDTQAMRIARGIILYKNDDNNNNKNSNKIYDVHSLRSPSLFAFPLLTNGCFDLREISPFKYLIWLGLLKIKHGFNNSTVAPQQKKRGDGLYLQ